MVTSAKGREFIARHEGLRLTPYKASPSERYWTVGYGHYGPDVKQGVSITLAQAKAYLREDLHTSEKAVRDQITRNLTQSQFDALVSFTYNLGTGALSGSTLRKRLNAGDDKGKVFRAELPKWVYAGGVKLPGLVTRRADEVRLATTGKYR